MAGALQDSIVVVTGASTGLGRAIAIEAAGQGARAVVVNYASNADEAEVTARAVREAGAEAVLAPGDVSRDDDCRAIVAAAARYGRIDTLVNNAAVTVFAAHGDMDAVSGEDFLRLYAVNVVGPFQMIRAARPLLEAGERVASVVNVASLAGSVGIGSSVPYAASKGALITMTLSLARALAPRIRVNALAPGFIDTPWFGKNPKGDTTPAVRASFARRTPLQEASSAEDIAGSAIFLASPAARHITGEVLTVDAGFHLGYSPLAMR